MATDEFDVFCSYAHSDNDDGWVDSFAAGLSAFYRKLTGDPCRIFVDRESLITSNIWERKIRTAVEGSQVLVAIVSPSFVRSEWCHREWQLFSNEEEQLRHDKLLAAEQGLIFPVLLYPLDRGRFDAQQEAFSYQIRQRQWIDFSSRLPGSPVRPDQVRQLVEEIIDTTAELQDRRRESATVAAPAPPQITIRDPEAHIEWSAEVSSVQMSYEAALEYVAQLNGPGEDAPWRLPTVQELGRIIDQSAVYSDERDEDVLPIRQPFRAQRYGYLHSGTLVPGYEEGNWILNLRNGHIFNGKGYEAFVRVVRNMDDA